MTGRVYFPRALLSENIISEDTKILKICAGATKYGKVKIIRYLCGNSFFELET